MDLKGSVALVTGGASGLGEATVRYFAEKGAKVAVFDLQVDRGRSLAKEFDGEVSFYEVDVCDEVQVQNSVDQIVETYGKLQVVVNCAGIVAGRKILGKTGGVFGPHPLAIFNKVIQVNLIGTFNVMRWAAMAMQGNSANNEGERGVVINTSSIAAFDGQIGQIAYAASKGAIASMTLPAARDLASWGIRVMSIAPGLFETPLMESLPDEVRSSLGKQVPFPPRFGYPSEFARLAAAIVENPMLNGEVIRLDGAVRMSPR